MMGIPTIFIHNDVLKSVMGQLFSLSISVQGSLLTVIFLSSEGVRKVLLSREEAAPSSTASVIGVKSVFDESRVA